MLAGLFYYYYLGKELENCLVSGGSFGIAEELPSALPPAPITKFILANKSTIRST
jgi:hypothetical protein